MSCADWLAGWTGRLAGARSLADPGTAALPLPLPPALGCGPYRNTPAFTIRKYPRPSQCGTFHSAAESK